MVVSVIQKSWKAIDFKKILTKILISNINQISIDFKKILTD